MCRSDIGALSPHRDGNRRIVTTIHAAASAPAPEPVPRCSGIDARVASESVPKCPGMGAQVRPGSGEQVDTRTASGRLVLNVLASVAQWEREATGERTSAAMR